MYVTSLGPPSMITRHRTPEAAVQVGFNDDRVIVSLDVPHARRLASILGLVGTGDRADQSVLTMPPPETGEWIHALVEVLAAAAIIGARPPAYAVTVLPVRRAHAGLGSREEGRASGDVSNLGPLTPSELRLANLADAGELDDTVLAGFICACGWTAIDQGPVLTPSYATDVEEHTAVCQVVDSEPTQLKSVGGGRR